MTIRTRQKSAIQRNHTIHKTFALFLLIVSMIFSNTLAAMADTTPASVTPAGVPVSDIEAIVDGVMEDKIGTVAPGASVVIVKDGEIIFCKGYGVSDVDAGTPVSGSDTIFEIGSVTKTITWTALMQLVDEGKVNLGDDIREYIGYDRLDLSFEKPITVLDLMNHTAGFEENISETMTYDREKLISLEDWISREHQPKQIYEPGSTIAYSNYGTSIAGYIIQSQSGLLYEDYIQEHIFTPLGMNMSTAYTDYYHLPHIVANKSKGYDPGKDGFVLLPENYITDAPAGSVMATAEDMGRYMIAHMNDEQSGQYSLFTSAETLEEMHTNSLATPGTMPANAHGFWTREEGGVRFLEHGGNTTNFTSLLSMVPEENFGVCVLTNVNGEATGMRTDIVFQLSAAFDHKATVNPSIDRSIDLSGTYASARTIKSTFLSIVYLLPEGLVVRDLKNGEIEVQLHGSTDDFPLRYAEIEPFVFERTDSTPSMMDKMGATMSHLEFIVDDSGEVQIVRTGSVTDYTKLPFHKNAPLNRTVVLFCVAVFVLSLIYRLITKIMAKKRGTQLLRGKASVILPVFGLLIGANTVVSLMRIMGDFSAPISIYWIHLLINLLLAIGMALAAIVLARKLHEKETVKKDKFVNVLLIVSTILFIIWLINYGLLTFWSL